MVRPAWGGKARLTFVTRDEVVTSPVLASPTVNESAHPWPCATIDHMRSEKRRRLLGNVCKQVFPF